MKKLVIASLVSIFAQNAFAYQYEGSTQQNISTEHTTAKICSIALTKNTSTFKFADEDAPVQCDRAIAQINANFTAIHSVAIDDTWSEDSTFWAGTVAPQLGRDYRWKLEDNRGHQSTIEREEQAVQVHANPIDGNFALYLYPELVHATKNLMNAGKMKVNTVINYSCI